MSNTEPKPDEVLCGAGRAGSTDGPPAQDSSAEGTVEIMAAREVPLGGPRAMSVRRTLPQKQRTLIGAWCFADHYGPDNVSTTGGMDVPPHPHTGLQTVSWLFEGEVEHRDSLGTHAIVRPGELNLMTGGSGIAHSEVSTPGTTTLHGVQLWVALPEAHRNAARHFEHFVPEPIRVGGGVLRVFLGSLGGSASPIRTFSPLLGAEMVIEAESQVDLQVQREFEHGILVDIGVCIVDGVALTGSDLAYLRPGRTDVTIVNSSLLPVRIILLGGPPFDEEIVMWWNFVGRSHEEIVEFRQAWENSADRFGVVAGYRGAISRLPAPGLPGGTLRPRGNSIGRAAPLERSRIEERGHHD